MTVWLSLLKEMLLPFATALGVVLGGAIGGSVAAMFTSGSPLTTLQYLGEDLKLWAVLIAIGGTFPTIRAIGTGLFDGEILALVRQIVLLVTSFMGAQMGHWLLVTLTGGE